MEPVERSVFLAQRVCQARDEAGLSNAELARRAGLPRRTIVRITNGANKARIQQETIEKIAGATGKPISFFSFTPGGASPRVAEAVETLYAALLADLRQELHGRESEPATTGATL